MPDILTHVLAAYTIATLLALRYDWLGSRYATIAMIGALVPDTTKIKLLVDSAQVEAWLGVPFSWGALHTLGGSIVIVLAGGVLVGRDHRKPVLLALVLGMLSHHALDLLIAHPAGHGYDLFGPLTGYPRPVAGLFHRSDRWPALVAAIAALGAYLLRYRVVDVDRSA